MGLDRMTIRGKGEGRGRRGGRRGIPLDKVIGRCLSLWDGNVRDRGGGAICFIRHPRGMGGRRGRRGRTRTRGKRLVVWVTRMWRDGGSRGMHHHRTINTHIAPLSRGLTVIGMGGGGGGRSGGKGVRGDPSGPFILHTVHGVITRSPYCLDQGTLSL